MSAIETMSPEATSGFFTRVMRAILVPMAARRRLRRTRVHLMELSDGELADIGLTREIAEREASRSLMACYLANLR